MILDKNLVFSDTQDVTGTAAAELASTNVYDSGAAGGTGVGIAGGAFYGYAKDWGPGQGLPQLTAEIRIVTTLTWSATTAGYGMKFAFQGSNTEGSGYVDIASVTIGGATLVAGYRVPFAIPSSGLVYRYYRFATTPAVVNCTDGDVTMLINLGQDHIHQVG